MKAYFDPSVIVGLALQEAQWQKIFAATGAVTVSCYSDYGFGEVISAIAIHARRHQLAKLEYSARFEDVRLFLGDWNSMSLQPQDIARATSLVEQVNLSLRLPDALHIAIAERIGATLVTTDRQQHRAALAIGVASTNPFADGTPA